MNRRSFIGSILALGSAPAIVRADSLMRIVPRDTSILFDGCSSYLRTAPFPLGEPVTVYMLYKTACWGDMGDSFTVWSKA